MPKGVNNNRGLVNFKLMRQDLSLHMPIRGGKVRNAVVVSRDSGITEPTLSRFMNGGGILTRENLAKMLLYLGQPLERYTGKEEVSKVVRSSGDTMKDIEKALRADKSLTPKCRRILSNLLNSSYRYTLEVLRASHTNNTASRTT
jgi:transcriptional regulator with XRE-family HTH domain